MENRNESLQQGQEGSGSAENRDQERESQNAPLAKLSTEEKQDIAHQIGEEEGSVASVQDLGQLSGRDDASGGMNDGMEDSSTGAGTDR